MNRIYGSPRRADDKGAMTLFRPTVCHSNVATLRIRHS